MDVKQIYELTNDIAKEVLGDSVILLEDLSNLIDVGEAVFNNQKFDAYSRSLVDKVGRVWIDTKVWKNSSVPNVRRDGWEYGAVLQRIYTPLSDAVENQSWELQNGQSYDPNIFNGATFESKFYQMSTTWEIDKSITEMQLKSAFNSAQEMNSLITAIWNQIDKSIEVRESELTLRLINSMICDTIVKEYGNTPSAATLASKSGIRAVNLLKLYNVQYSKSLTKTNALTDPDFLRYASYIMGLYVDRLQGLNSQFNLAAYPNFTSKDNLHCVMLSEFERASDVFLQSDTFHNMLVSLPKHTTIPYFQDSNTYAFGTTSKIKVKTPTIDATSQSNCQIETDGILAVMFDHEALGINCADRRTTTQYNAKAEFTNYFMKIKENYFTDDHQNFVVFFVA